MANIITEYFVSLDGLEFVKLDLHKDEAINMKHTQKDLKDLSKIFAPFSQGFTFPATPKNRAAFGFFGDTDVIKINKESKFSAKSYINGVLNSTGYLKLEGLSYSYGKPRDFTGSFVTNMTNLKDRIGDDLISELAGEPVLVKWSVEGVQNMVRSSQTLTIGAVPVKYFVPLISINRVWGYDATNNSEILDNIAYNPAADIKGSNLIRPEELRPCISYSSILDLIKKKYEISVVSPLEERDEFKDLRVWCNAEQTNSDEFKVLPILNDFGAMKWRDTKNIGNILGYPDKYRITTDLGNNIFQVWKRPEPFQRSGEWIQKAFQFETKFNGVTVTGSGDAPEVTLQFVRASDNVVFQTVTKELEGNIFDIDAQIDDEVFGVSDELNFYLKVKFSEPTSWTSCDFEISMRFYDGKVGFLNRKEYAWFYKQSLSNNNSSLVSTDDLDLFKSLPETKVIDFLSSHFKAFNISVFDTSPDTDDLFWLTPQDIASKGRVYSKATLDYTNYLDAKEYAKSKPNDYNYYNFRHAESEYFSNRKYFEAFGLEYGQTVYPAEKPRELIEFSVETDFSIIPPVKLQGAAGIDTAYGFTADEPEIIETGETRYTPNFDELTVFYTHGSTSCVPLGLLGVTRRLVAPMRYESFMGVYGLTSYIKVMPWNKGGFSFGFSVLKNNGIEYENSLYLRYYSEQTERLLNPNVLSQSFSLTLPAHEIHLNESASVQGAGLSPLGFRLQNDIIIGEDLFSIIDATIDQTTGKTKITLLNY